MARLASALDPRAAEYQANRDAMQALVTDLRRSATRACIASRLPRNSAARGSNALARRVMA